MLTLRKASLLLRFGLDSDPSPLPVPQAESEKEQGDMVFSMFLSQVLLCSSKVVGKADSLRPVGRVLNELLIDPRARSLARTESSFQGL